MKQENSAFGQGAREIDEQSELLAKIVSQLDELADHEVHEELLDNLLNWLAHFTREHFGFQERLMKAYFDGTELECYLSAHSAWRKQLAALYFDALRSDVTVARRLRELGHQLLAEVQSHDRGVLERLSRQPSSVRLRRRNRIYAAPLVSSWEQLLESWSYTPAQESRAASHHA